MDTSIINISPTMIAAIAARHGLGTQTFTPLHGRGTATSVYLLDDSFVLRVPRADPACIAGLTSDTIAVPAARAAGVRTPQLIVCDKSCQLLPVPYAIYERVHGAALDTLALQPEDTPALWHELGCDLARLHSGATTTGRAGRLRHNRTDLDPRPWLDELAAVGQISAAQHDWLHTWLDRLGAFACTPVLPRLCHGDVNASNIMLDPVTRRYLALIDWGGAGWGDASWDFVPVSLRAVPLMLEGYRAVAALDDDATAEARILWHHLQLAIHGLHHNRQRGRVWAAQRIEQLQRDLELFVAQPRTRWIAQLR